MRKKKKTSAKKIESIDLTKQAAQFVSLVKTAFTSIKRSVRAVYRDMVTRQVKHTFSVNLASANDDQVNRAKRLVNKIIYAQGESAGLNKDSLKVYCSLASRANSFPVDAVQSGNAKSAGKGKRKGQQPAAADSVPGVVLIDTNKENFGEELESKLASLLSLFQPKVHLDTIVSAFNHAVAKTKFKNKLVIKAA